MFVFSIEPKASKGPDQRRARIKRVRLLSPATKAKSGKSLREKEKERKKYRE